MDHLPATIANNNGLAPEMHGGLLLLHYDVAIGIILFDYALFLDGCRQHLAIFEELNGHNSVTGVKYPPLEHSLDVVQDVIACVIQEHADNAQWNNVGAEVLHELVDWSHLVEILETVERYPFE